MHTLIRLALAGCLLLSGFGVSAQADETLASKFRLDLSGAWGGWHTQLSALGDENVFLQGGYGGLEFNKTIFIGWGAYRLQDAVTFAAGAGAREVDFNYHGPMLYYTPYARSVVHPKFGIQTGFGKVDITGESRDKVAVLHPYLGGEVNVLRWLRVGGDVGYRFAFNTAPGGPGDEFFSGLVGQLSLKLGFSWGADSAQDGSVWD